MAYLTYDMTRHLFVKVMTGEMLENPFNFNSIYDTHELYGLEITKPDVDIKILVAKQLAQEHSGMVLTDKDAVVLQHSAEFRSVELNQKFLSLSVKNDEEGNRIERELHKYQQQQEAEAVKAKYTTVNKDYTIDEDARKKEAIQMTYWENRKLNEHH